MFLLYLLFIIAAIIALICLIWAISNLHSVLAGAPAVGTPKNDIYSALACANPKQGEYLVDLGCGDGRILYVAAKAFGLHGTGYEISIFENLLAKIKIYLFNLHRKIKIKRTNLNVVDLSNADIIYVYLYPQMLKNLSEKLTKQLKAGARVISYAFAIPGWQADKIFRSPNNEKTNYYLYKIKNQKESDYLG